MGEDLARFWGCLGRVLIEQPQTTLEAFYRLVLQVQVNDN